MLTGEQLKQLDRVFHPRGVAVVGAGSTSDKVGFNLVESLVFGGYQGRIYPVHPKLDKVLDLKVYRSLEEIDGPLDVVVIALNQFTTVEVVEQCGALGVQGVVSVAGGYREMGSEGRDLEARLIKAARDNGIILIGPNTLGIINNQANFYSTFYPLRLLKGSVSFISQSGGLGLTFMQRSQDEGLGINKWIGVGNRGTLEFADYLQYLGQDTTTSVIGVFMEGTEDARGFVETVGEIAPHKPVVVYKVGRSELASYSALTHTGTLAGSYKMYQDVFEQFGVITTSSISELVAACKAFSISPLPSGEQAAVFTHTAGPSIVAVDELASAGVSVPSLGEETIRKIKGIIGENPPVVLKNPLDVAGLGFMAEVYGQLAQAVAEDPNIDLVLAIYCLHKNWRFPTPELIRVKQLTGKPVIACYISTLQAATWDRIELQVNGIPLYITAEEAAWAAGALVRRVRWLQEKEGRIPDNALRIAPVQEFSNDHQEQGVEKPQLIETGIYLQKVRESRNQGSKEIVLTEPEAKEVLASAGIPVTTTYVVDSVEAASQTADQIGYPVVLKVVSATITHKSDIGGVYLNLRNKQQVRDAYKSIAAAAAKVDSAARVSVQKMAPTGREVIIGVTRDPSFGPVLMCGLGGIFTEVLKDVAFSLIPVNRQNAFAMLRSLQAFPLLKGIRGAAAVDLEGLVDIILKVSVLVERYPEIKELDLNPVAAYEWGAQVLDARLVLST